MKEKKCKHQWVRSDITYTSYPAQWDVICKRCGIIERRTQWVEKRESFDEIKERFHGKKK